MTIAINILHEDEKGHLILHSVTSVARVCLGVLKPGSSLTAHVHEGMRIEINEKWDGVGPHKPPRPKGERPVA